MTTKNTSEMSSVQFGVYQVDKDYIRSLMKNDLEVFDPELTNIYIGPAHIKKTEHGEDCYFVPVDLSYREFRNCKHFMPRFARKLIYLKSIICNDSSLITPYDSDEKLIQFCKEHPEWVVDPDKWKTYSSDKERKRILASYREPIYCLWDSSRITDADGEMFRRIQYKLLPDDFPHTNSKELGTASQMSSDIEFGVYLADEDYIQKLRKIDRDITDPEVSLRYVGPVCRAETSEGIVDFFVPVVLPAETEILLPTENFCGIYANIMDFRRMIPIYKKYPVSLTRDMSNENLIRFCNDRRRFIEECGMIMFAKKERLEDEEDEYLAMGSPFYRSLNH